MAGLFTTWRHANLGRPRGRGAGLCERWIVHTFAFDHGFCPHFHADVAKFTRKSDLQELLQREQLSQAELGAWTENMLARA